MNHSVYKILIAIIIVFSFAKCAKRGRPTGGEKDETAPILISASPDHESINFDAKKIKIYFDEYVKLKDMNKQLIISPPLKNTPDISPVGTASKLLTIKLFDTLKENTTYTLNFGNSVVDNNEGNILGGFKYVFSTGTYLDSLKISGDISDSFSRKTDNEIIVMLYEIDSTFNDSIIYKEKPKYVSSTLDSTNYELTNLKEGSYLLLALKQPNNNYIFNPKQDKIGFYKDTITLPGDTSFSFSIFKEILPFKVLRGIETTQGHIIFGFEGDAKEINLKLLDEITTDYNSEVVFEKGKDTLSYWFKNIEKDSLLFEITNQNYIDTLTVQLKSKKKDSLILKSNFNSTLNPRDTFAINSNIPISKIDTSKITLFNKDTIAVPFSTKLDSYKTSLYLNFKQNFQDNYSIQLLPNALSDVFGNINDTLNFKVRTKKLEDYGIISLTISNVNSPVIIQLITEKDELIASQKIASDQTLRFRNLPPKTYIARAIIDENDNGKWDTGNFLLKTHPEKVQYYDGALETRANWDVDYVFILK